MSLDPKQHYHQFFLLNHCYNNFFFLENGVSKSKEGKANHGYKTGDEDVFMLSRISTHDLLASIERLASDPSMQNLDVRTLDAVKSLRSLVNDQRFQKSFQFAQKVKRRIAANFFGLFLLYEKLIEYPCCYFFFS